MSEEVKYEDRVRAAYRSAQGNVAQEFSPHIGVLGIFPSKVT